MHAHFCFFRNDLNNIMKILSTPKSILLISLLFSGCATGVHGDFVPHTYIDKGANPKGESIGNVSGLSSQTWFLYIFPLGESPSTDKAIDDAMGKINGTNYLSNMSIEGRVVWGIGYKKQTIKVEAEARN
jgi:hypothetical protein